MALLKIGDYLINSKVISLVELYPAAGGRGEGCGSDRVAIYLPRAGREGVAGIGGCLHFDDPEEVQAIRCFFNDPDNSEITFITKPASVSVREGKQEAFELDEVPF
jgi:hypothetical protein